MSEKGEIIQPDISKPDPKDPLEWAKVPRVYDEWVRHVAPQLGMDAERLILGGALLQIIDDDANVFPGSRSSPPEASRIGQIMKDSLLERLGQEIEAGMPEDIKERLKETRDRVMELDWQEVEGWEAAYQVWSPIRAWLDQRVRGDHELWSAKYYFTDAMTNSELARQWSLFLYGEAPDWMFGKKQSPKR